MAGRLLGVSGRGTAPDDVVGWRGFFSCRGRADVPIMFHSELARSGGDMSGTALSALWGSLREQIHDAIAKHGQSVQVVYLTAADPPGSQPFMYTVGNHQVGLPELLVVDTDSSVIAGVLNRLGQIQRERGTGFADEEYVSVGGQFPVRIVDAGEVGRSRYATFVGIYYGTQDYQVRQVLLPDTKGRWPDTPGCDLPYARQPVLSKINAARRANDGAE
jgi:hypothetical protein